METVPVEIRLASSAVVREKVPVPWLSAMPRRSAFGYRAMPRFA
jgi:hypothetical protein